MYLQTFLQDVLVSTSGVQTVGCTSISHDNWLMWTLPGLTKSTLVRVNVVQFQTIVQKCTLEGTFSVCQQGPYQPVSGWDAGADKNLHLSDAD